MVAAAPGYPGRWRPRFSVFTQPPAIVRLLFACAATAAAAELRPMRPGTELFVDDVQVARRENATRRVVPVQRLPRPVLVADQPWERGGAVRIYGTVHRDAATGEFRMWYSRQYATSRDGISWVKPALDVELFAGRPTNFVLPKGGGAVVIDELEPDPAKRYKALCSESIRVGGFSAYHSADGIHWTRYGRERVLTAGSELGHVIRDPATRKYLAYLRPYPPKHFPKSEREKRLGAVATSDDFVRWSEPRVVLVPDAVDDAWVTRPEQRTEFYAMNGFAYGQSYLGIVPIFRITQIHATNAPGQSRYDGPMEGQLITSRDGLEWHRMRERDPILPGGPDFDRSIMNVAVAPIVVGDEVWLYYTAINATHGAPIPPKRITIGRAAWRLDRFVALDAGGDEAVMETAPLGGRGGPLEVNADLARGRLTVEVIDAAGTARPGYSAAECAVLTGDALRHRVRWGRRETVPGDESLRLRFRFRHGSLYSYTLPDSPEERP